MHPATAPVLFGMRHDFQHLHPVTKDVVHFAIAKLPKQDAVSISHPDHMPASDGATLLAWHYSVRSGTGTTEWRLIDVPMADEMSVAALKAWSVAHHFAGR